MNRASTITTLGAALAMAATAAGADEDSARPEAPAVQSQYSIVEANPDNGTATIEVNVHGGENYQRTMQCDELAFQQEAVERDIIDSATTFFAWGTDDERYQAAQLELGLGHTTLAKVYEYASDEMIARNQEYNGLTHAALYGADRKVFIEAQIQAGCLKPKPAGQ